jgi:hypothetical protein
VKINLVRVFTCVDSARMLRTWWAGAEIGPETTHI